MKIRFSDFVLDEERYSLERQGKGVALRPKVFDLLLELARHRSRVVRREELVDRLWKGMAVGPGSLSGLVNELRQALGEDGRGASSIRTVHARGYQFVARVDEIPSGANPDRVAEQAAPARVRIERAPESFSTLFERVSETGSCGILLPQIPASGVEDPQRDGASRWVEDLAAEAAAADFELRVLGVPESSRVSPARFARQILEALVESRGPDRVRSALPLPARVWFEQDAAHPVAGGYARASGGPPGGLGAIGALLSELARRRPIVWLLENIDRGGPDFARDLGVLVERLVDDPVLWVGTLRGGGKGSRSVVDVLEGRAGFVRWSAPPGPPACEELSQRLRSLGHAPFPTELCDALVAHVDGDVAAVEEIARWMKGQASTSVRGPNRGMRRVEPRPRSAKSVGLES